MAQVAQDAKGNYYTSEDGKDWKPAPVAQNAKGDKFYNDGTTWKPAQVAAPKPQGKPISQVAEQGPWQAGTQASPFTAPRVTGNRTADIALEPVTGYPGRVAENYDFSRRMEQQGLGDIMRGDFTGLAGYVPGAIGMATAPISALMDPGARVLHSFVGQPLEDATGLPAPIIEAALMAAPGLRGGPRVPAAERGFKPPTNETLRAQAKADYKAVDNAGLMVNPHAMTRLYQNVTSDLADFAYDPALQPGIAPAINRLSSNMGANVTLKGLDTVRRIANHAASDVHNPSQQAAAHIIIDHIDDLVDNLTEHDVIPGSGDPKTIKPVLDRARNAWARLSKSELIDDAIERAQSRAGSTGAGGNVDNAIRQNIRQLLDNKRTRRKFSDEEQKMLRQVVEGDMTRNALRGLGKFSPTHGFLPMAAAASATLTMPHGFMLPLLGYAAKTGADTMTLAAAQRAGETIRAGNEAPGNYGRNVVRHLSAQLPKTRNYVEQAQRATALGAINRTQQSPDETPP